MIVIDYENVVHEDLPIDAQQVVTGVNLVVAGDIAGEKPKVISDGSARYTGGEVQSYIPLPAVHEHRDPLHDEYNFFKTVKLADYFDPFLPAPEVLGTGATLQMSGDNFQPGDGTQIMDGDDETFIENKFGWDENNRPDNVGVIYTYPKDSEFARKVIGWRLVYSAKFAPTDQLFFGNIQRRTVRMTHERLGEVGTGDVVISPTYDKTAIRDIDDTGEDVRDMYAVFLPQIHMDKVNVPEGMDPIHWTPWKTTLYLSILADEMTSPGDLKTYHFYPLVLNEPKLEAIAQAEIVLPAVRPGRLYVKGYVAPDSAVTVQGFPGGNIVAATKSFEYMHTRDEGLMTIISLEQDSIMSEADYGQRRRAIDEMMNRKISREGYSVLMGERI